MVGLGGWKRGVGAAIIERRDGLCVGAYTTDEYVPSHPVRPPTAAAIHAHPEAVALSLVYC